MTPLRCPARPRALARTRNTLRHTDKDAAPRQNATGSGEYICLPGKSAAREIGAEGGRSGPSSKIRRKQFKLDVVFREFDQAVEFQADALQHTDRAFVIRVGDRHQSLQP